jgi:cardiolipin synthase A/B
MNNLLEAISLINSTLSPEKVRLVADRIRQTNVDGAAVALATVVGTPSGAMCIHRLTTAWRKTQLSSDELSLMIVASNHSFTQAASQQSVELVWTGPTTPFVSARRTEQTLLQVINASTNSLFMTSFVAYDVPTLVVALNNAIARGVKVSLLLELSQKEGGTISFDSIGVLRSHVPKAIIYYWRYKDGAFLSGSVHAKIALADSSMCFITSANLTGKAMDKNMEAGVLIEGGKLPQQLYDHLESLVSLKLIDEYMPI